MIFRLAVALAVLMAVLSGCRCDPRIVTVEPEPIPVEPTPATPPPPACPLGTVSGKVCAPDKKTWVEGAVVAVDGQDCNGQPFHLVASSAIDGSFVLGAIPAGMWTAHANLGAFSQEYPVDRKSVV